MSKKKNLWPIALTIVIVSMVTFLLGFIVLSLNLDDSLVSEKYYMDAIEYQHTIDRLKNAKQHGQMKIFQNDDLVTLEAPFNIDSGRVQFMKPNKKFLDRDFDIELNTHRQYSCTLPEGLWNYTLYWSANNMDFQQEGDFIIP